MSILTVKNLSLQFGDKVLYHDANLDLYRSEHLGLVGANGEGKSTFFTCIIGTTHPDGGSISWHPKTKIGYLDQHAQLDLTLTIKGYLQQSFADLFAINERLEANLKKIEHQYQERTLGKIINDQEILATMGFDQISSKVGRVASGLGLTSIGLDTPLAHLSGGQKTKTILAKLLLDEPNILLLDEPTNFLDQVHVDWLRLYLKDYPQAFILISHDPKFLDDVTTHTALLENGSFKKYRGNYSHFLRQKQEQDEALGKQSAKQAKLIAKTQDFITRKRARTSTARQAQSLQKKLDKIIRLTPPTPPKPPRFYFTAATPPRGQALTTTDLIIGYHQPLLPPLNFSFPASKRVAIIGRNGIGKSTLLKTLMGELTPLAGSFEFAYGTTSNYFDQELHFQDPLINPLELINEQYPQLDQKAIRGMLARFGVHREHVRQPLVSLSGGEQTKVKFALLALRPGNCLLLDEPTNHLDVLAKQSLKTAIKEFSGSVILVSHERDFYADLVEQVWDIGKLAQQL